MNKSEYMKQWRKDNPDKAKQHAKKNHAKFNPRRMWFMNKSVYLENNPRIGVCTQCGKEGRTEIHHIQYHDNDPLKDTIELCSSCHMTISMYKRWSCC